jgi:hypothetical protein
MNNTFMDRVNAIVAKNQNASVADDNQNSVSNVPRYANLMNQPHMLAYINPQEEQMLRDAGGAGAPGPDGIPVYGWWSDTWSEIKSGGKAETATYNSPKDNTPAPVVNTPPPVNTNSNSASIGAVSSGGQYAGDGFEWKENPGGYLTRTYTGVNQNLTGSYDAPTGFSNPNVQQFASDSPPPPAPAPEPEVTDSSSFFTGGGSDGVGKYGAVGDFFGFVGDALGVTNYGSQAARNTGSPYQRTFTQEQLDALDTENTTRESFANLLTPFDNAEYIGGNLVTEIEPGVFQDLTGGGVIRNKAGALDRIYGVSDDFSNNAPIEQGNMSNQDYAIALARQKMLEDKPPSDAAYFSSFIPGAIVPVVGGYLGQQMVEPGVKARQAEIDRQVAALQEGGTPQYEDGNYTGYKTSSGSFVPFNTDKPDPMVTDNYGALNIGPPPDDNPSPEVVYQDQQIQKAAQNVFNRYYRGGSGAALPYWLRRYASGQVVDMDLTRVNKDGVEYYQDENNMLIPVSELPNLKMVEN